MGRKNGTDKDGKDFPDSLKKQVWEKGKIVSGIDKDKKRQDACGAWIEWDKHGETVSNGNGWEIDHIKPVAEKGDDDITNLQPLQWQNNRSKGDTYPAKPSEYCKCSAAIKDGEK